MTFQEIIEVIHLYNGNMKLLPCEKEALNHLRTVMAAYILNLRLTAIS